MILHGAKLEKEGQVNFKKAQLVDHYRERMNMQLEDYLQLQLLLNELNSTNDTLRTEITKAKQKIDRLNKDKTQDVHVPDNLLFELQ